MMVLVCAKGSIYMYISELSTAPFPFTFSFISLLGIHDFAKLRFFLIDKLNLFWFDQFRFEISLLVKYVVILIFNITLFGWIVLWRCFCTVTIIISVNEQRQESCCARQREHITAITVTAVPMEDVFSLLATGNCNVIPMVI